MYAVMNAVFENFLRLYRGKQCQKVVSEAFLVLFGTLPFDNNSANALPHKMTHAINERLSRLNAAVDEANEERDR